MTNDEKDRQIMHFVAVETIQNVADKEFEKQKNFLKELIHSADIQHVGSTAVPGSITKGDVDIQVRTDKAIFDHVRELLTKHYNPNRKDEIWTDGFASFENYKNPVIPVGVQLTVIDSPYDEFYKMRDLLIKDEHLLNKYNAIKRQCEGKTYKEYRKLKRGIFGVNGSSPLLKLDQKPDNQAVEIERATPDDAEIICDIRDRAWIEAYLNPELGITAKDIEINAKGLHGEFVPKRIAYLKNKLSSLDRPDGATFVAKIDGKVVGFAEPSIENGKRRVGALFVAPEAQGKGVGSKLIQQDLDWHGHNEDIFLEVIAYNQNAIDFYKRFGFEQTDAIVPEESNLPSFIKSLPQIKMVLEAGSK